MDAFDARPALLLVEDDADDQRIFQWAMKKSGLGVTIRLARDGDQAIRFLERGPQRPFLVVSDYLARHGIASLRCDDRGTAKSTGNFRAATSADFAVDADSALFSRLVFFTCSDRRDTFLASGPLQ